MAQTTWQSEGVAISSFRTSLVIAQTEEVHRGIAELPASLRQAEQASGARTPGSAPRPDTIAAPSTPAPVPAPVPRR